MPENKTYDPVVMYVIVRESLGMSIGKCCAQVGHATQKVLLHYFKCLALNAKLHVLPQIEEEHNKLTGAWLANGSTKVILKADEKEWGELKTEFGKSERFIIIDEGRTEIEHGSETVMAFMPQRKNDISKSIKRLRLL